MPREINPVTYYDDRNATSYDLDQRIDLSAPEGANAPLADDGPDVPAAPVAGPATIQTASEGDAPIKGTKAASPRVPKG